MTVRAICMRDVGSLARANIVSKLGAKEKFSFSLSATLEPIFSVERRLTDLEAQTSPVFPIFL